MKRIAFSLVLVALLLGGVVPARADVTIQMKHNTEPQTLYVAPHAFQTATDGGKMIFRGDQKLLWMVDDKEKKYTELTEADAKAMGAKLGEAMAQMQEALKNAPPAQRAMMEKMMKGQMAGMTPKERTVKAMGQTKTINGFECAGYTVSVSDGSSTEVWAAEPKAIHLDPKDISVWKDFAEFMKAMLPGVDQFKDLIKDYDNPGKDQVPGFPVLSIQRDKAGKEIWRSELVSVEKGSIPAEKFEVPAGFKKDKAKLDE
jgi:hypothetical protein